MTHSLLGGRRIQYYKTTPPGQGVIFYTGISEVLPTFPHLVTT
jgi:hypothetical protein